MVDFLIKSAKQYELIRFLQIRYGKGSRTKRNSMVVDVCFNFISISFLHFQALFACILVIFAFLQFGAAPPHHHAKAKYRAGISSPANNYLEQELFYKTDMAPLASAFLNIV